MGDWIDKLHDEAIARGADKAIQHEKHELAQEYAPNLHASIRREINRALDRIRPGTLEKTDKPGGVTRIGTQSWPLQIVEYRFLSHCIEYARSTKAGWDDPEVNLTTGFIRICVEFNSNPWFEHNGQRLSSASEVVECLLSDIFKRLILN